MGYTHYWEFSGNLPKEEFEMFVEDMKQIVKNGEIEFSRFSYSPNDLFLDGPEGKTSETFCVRRKAEDCFSPATKESIFQFCKTRRYPYDDLVCAGLIALKNRMGSNIAISSDGRIPQEFKRGIKLYKDILNEPLPDQFQRESE